MMKSAIFEKYGEPLQIKHQEIPDPPPKGAVIKTSFSGVCHSDIHHWQDDFNSGPARLPLTLGHEISGVVHSLGAEDDEGSDNNLKVGDRVMVYPWIGCADCGLCLEGQPQVCPKTTYRMGIFVAGGYSTYVSVIGKRFVLKLPEKIPLDVACMLPCSALTTYNAVSKTISVLEIKAKLLGKGTLLVIGAGGLGLWCIQIARAVLPKSIKILSADITKEKLQNAKENGADKTVLWDLKISDEDAVKVAQNTAESPTIDAIIDVVGASQTVKRALSLVSKGGVIVPVGLFKGKFDSTVQLLVFKSLAIRGVSVGSVEQLKEITKLIEEGKVKGPPRVFCSLEDINTILNDLNRGKINGRAIIKF